MTALRTALGSRYAGVAALLLAGLAACQGVELGVGVKPAVPPPDPDVARQIGVAQAEVAVAEEWTHEAARLAAEAEAARAAAAASVADLERQLAAGEATQDELDRACRRATEAAAYSPGAGTRGRALAPP